MFICEESPKSLDEKWEEWETKTNWPVWPVKVHNKVPIKQNTDSRRTGRQNKQRGLREKE